MPPESHYKILPISVIICTIFDGPVAELVDASPLLCFENSEFSKGMHASAYGFESHQAYFFCKGRE